MLNKCVLELIYNLAENRTQRRSWVGEDKKGNNV